MFAFYVHLYRQYIGIFSYSLDVFEGKIYIKENEVDKEDLASRNYCTVYCLRVAIGLCAAVAPVCYRLYTCPFKELIWGVGVFCRFCG